jgi:hypothetical protein
MMRRAAAIVLAINCSLVSLSADLKYTMTVTARPSTVAATEPTNPILGLLGPMVVNTIAPPGGVQVTTTIGARASRFEYDKGYTIIPAGGVLIVTTDGTFTVLNPAERTYWKLAKPAGLGANAVAPVVKVERTGSFETIAGVRAERATIDIRMPLPLPPGTQMPGLPSDVAVTGETWLADQYKKYAAMSAGVTSVMGSLGPDAVAAAGFPMRSIMRSELFGGQEIESIVTSISEADSVPGAFDVPSDYKEVPPPRFGMPGMPMGSQK